MKSDTFFAIAPFLTAGATFLLGILALDANPLIAGAVSLIAGFAYDWIETHLP